MNKTEKQVLPRQAHSLLSATFSRMLCAAEKQQPVVIYGAGNAGRYVAALCMEHGIRPAGFIDDFCGESTAQGLPVLPVAEGLASWQPKSVILGTLVAQDRMMQHLKGTGFNGQIFMARDEFSTAQTTAAYKSRVSSPDLIRIFQNRHKGERAFVIGNGPSLLKTNPKRLKNELTFACNNIHLLKGFAPTYYVAEDFVMSQDRAEIINALPWVKFFHSMLAGWLDNGIFFQANLRQWPEEFSVDLTKKIEIGFTVTFVMMQVAYWMGCNPVYLLGLNHHYIVDKDQHTAQGTVFTSVKDDPNHFHPGYFGAGYRWHDPKVERMEAAYRLAKDAYEKDGRKIYNATAGGKLELFERVNFEELGV